MSFVLSKKSRAKLTGVHKDLVRVVDLAIAISAVDFMVTCGLRTLEEQKVLVATGKSKTMKSKHLTGHAVDLAPIIDGKISWKFNDFIPIAEAMQKAAKELGVSIVWGADWDSDGDIKEHSFIDAPHFQLG